MNDLNEACSPYPHLQHIHFPNLSDNKIQILLGVDATQYILEREFLQGPSGSPFALRNILGGTITGPIKRKSNPIQQEINFLSLSYRAFDHALTNLTVDTERHLSECVTSFWKIENTGTEFEETADTSTDSKRAVQILQDTIHHIGDRYENGLLWKQDSKLENNYPVAKAQLDSLQRRLNKDIELKQLYEKTLDTDLEKGYVKPVTFSNPAPEKIWYLPHHPVTNPNKPGKVRRVANAASVFKKQSLNKNLLSGPDLLNNLVGLLLRFLPEFCCSNGRHRDHVYANLHTNRRSVMSPFSLAFKQLRTAVPVYATHLWSQMFTNYSNICPPRNSERLRKHRYKRSNIQQFLHG